MINSDNDWQLIDRARTGDHQAFAVLVMRYQEPVVHFCYRMTGSLQDAEDLAQESFIRVHGHLDRLQPKAKFSTLLFGIARNLTLNFLRDMARRGRGKMDSLDSIAGSPNSSDSAKARPDTRAQLNEIASHIEKALAVLSQEHREVLVLREINGLDYDTIAEITGCKKGTVRSRLARAREQLRLTLLQRGGNEL